VSRATVGELSHVVGEDGVDPIGDSLDQASQEVRGPGRITFSSSSMKANHDVRSIATMRRSCLSDSNFGDVDVELAGRVDPELTLRRGFARDLRKPRYPVALKATMQRPARQMRDYPPQSI
jgi:hypothetical protein